MSWVPVGVGNTDAQRRFLRDHEAFLREYSEIHALLRKVFIRMLVGPSEEEIKLLDGLPDTDSAVLAFKDKHLTDRVVFYLGRVAVEDFSELLILSGNGYGIGAFKILRGMYESIVTAAFVAKNPSEARVFLEEGAIKKWKLWQQLVSVMPEIKSRYTEEQIRALEENYNEAHAKRKASFCKKCKQPIMQDAWTRLDLASMASKADPNLAVLYCSCYLEPTFHSHATAYGLGRRIRQTEGGVNTFRESSEHEARMAVLLGHNLILRLLTLQNDHFKLGLEADIQERLAMFPKIWDKGFAETSQQGTTGSGALKQ